MSILDMCNSLQVHGKVVWHCLKRNNVKLKALAVASMCAAAVKR